MKKLLLIVLCALCANGYSQITVSTLTTEFNGAGGIVLDDSGNLYIADFGDFLGGPDNDGIPNNVMKLDTDLNLTVYADDFTGASGNEFDSNGVLFQADIRDNAVYKIINGSREFYASAGLISPVGIAFDSSDNLYVCNCGASNVRKIEPDGTSTVFSTGNGFFACPNGMTIDEDNNLYVVNFSNPFIVKITPDGTATNIGNTGFGNGHVDYDVNTNNLYIASFGGNKIFYLDLDDLGSGAIEIAGTGVAGNDDGDAIDATFSAPNGIAVSKTGDSIYVNSSVTLNNANLNPQYVRLLTNVSSLSANKYKFEGDVKAYPIPAKNEFILESSLIATTNNVSVTIRDINGRTINKFTQFNGSEPSKLRVDTSSLQAGVYFYSLESGKRTLKTGKFIKE